MDSGVAYLFVIVFLVVALNFYIVIIRMRRGNRRRKKMTRVAVDEAKQALWRDREIERRLEREQDGALERVKLREETLAFYEEVRRRHADRERLEGLGFSSYGSETTGLQGKDTEPESLELEGTGLESIRLENPELNSYLAGREPVDDSIEERVELLEWDSNETDNDMDPFDIFRKKNK